MLISPEKFIFNPKSTLFNKNPYAIYKKMRENYPIYSTGNTWVLTRYQDIFQNIRNDNLGSSVIPDDLIDKFKKNAISLSEESVGIICDSLVFQDGKPHSTHRKTYMRLFSSAEFSELKALISDEIAKLFKKIKYQKSINVIEQIATPLWYNVFTRWLKLLPEESRVLQNESDNIRLMLDPSTITRHGLIDLSRALATLIDLFRHDYQRNKGADCPSLFFRALYCDDIIYSEKEYITDAILAFIGGGETTAALIGNMFFLLADHQGELEKLRKRPELLRNCVQEVMRIESPLQMTRRRVANDFIFNKTQFHAGDNVLLCLGAANRDETIFPDPDRFAIERENCNKHLGFGFGMHQCIGKMLAQFQAEATCHEMLTHFPHISRNSTDEPVWQKKSLIIRGLSSLILNTGL